MGLRRFSVLSTLAILGCAEEITYEPVHVHRFDGSISVSILAGEPGPTWFGPHPVLVMVDDGNRQLVINERLRNDGANLSARNFPITLEKNKLVVCFRGQEQTDVRYEIALHSNEQPRKVAGACP